jgi:homogentisate 1,2-dioxygenase
LANEKDFEYPVAAYDDDDSEWEIANKFMGQFYRFTQAHTPYDVVAYSGNYVPYRYVAKVAWTPSNVYWV